jgi:glycosyltransferase involved in cell wall biosynthesis
LHPAATLHAFPIDGLKWYITSHALDQWCNANIAAFDIVHLHSLWQFPTFAAARACWRHKKPYMVLLNGMLDSYSVRQSAWLKRVYWFLREGKIEGRAAGIHCLNRAEIRRSDPWIKGMPKFILPNGIDAAQLADVPPRGAFRAAMPELADKPLVLFLSRLHPKKGLDRLIPAWKNVAARLPEARLLIAGTGESGYIALLKGLVSANNLQSRIIFLGQVIGAQKWQLLADADVFVLPSHQEGFSMAISESLAAGCPPIVTEECNFDELVPPPPETPCGAIVRNGDMRAFTDMVVELLRNPGKRRLLATAGKMLVASRYTWQKVAVDLEHIYRHILAGKPLAADGSDVWRVT